MPNCTFLVNSIFDADGKRRYSVRERQCGKPGAWYRATGSLSSFDMVFCDQHRDFIAREYGWYVTRIEDKE